MTRDSGKGWIGLDMGHRSIAVAQLERTGAGMRIAASAEMPRTAGVSAGGLDDTGYHDVSKQELETVRLLAPGLKGRTAVCVLPMSVTELTHESLPPGEPAEQYAMITNELGDGEQKQFDFWPSCLSNDGQTSSLVDVNVISIARARTNAVADQVTAARMDCRVLDGLPHAVARAVAMAVPDHFGRPAAGLHLAYDNALFVLSVDGIPAFARELRGGGFHRIVSLVRESLGLLDEEAVHVLREFGLPCPSPATWPGGRSEQVQDVIGEVAAKVLDGIVEELKRTLAYLASLDASNVPDSICLLGEGAAVRNLPAYLSAKADLSMWNWGLPGMERHSVSEPHHPLLAVACALSSLAWES